MIARFVFSFSLPLSPSSPFELAGLGPAVRTCRACGLLGTAGRRPWALLPGSAPLPPPPPPHARCSVSYFMAFPMVATFHVIFRASATHPDYVHCFAPLVLGDRSAGRAVLGSLVLVVWATFGCCRFLLRGRRPARLNTGSLFHLACSFSASRPPAAALLAGASLASLLCCLLARSLSCLSPCCSLLLPFLPAACVLLLASAAAVHAFALSLFTLAL